MAASAGAVAIQYKIAKDAIELTRTWSVWLAGLNTSIIAAVAIIIKSDHLCSMSKPWMIATIFGAAGSLLVSNFTLSGLPYLVTHLVDGTSTANDIWETNVYRYKSAPRLKVLLFLQSCLWSFAIVAFAGFVMNSFCA